MTRENVERILLFLSMSEMLAAITGLIFAFDILRVNPSTSNFPALSAYVMSIFGLFSSVFTISGVTRGRQTPIIIAKMINWVTLAGIIPTISFHVKLLASLAEIESEIDFNFDPKKVRPAIWILAAQIIIFSFLLIVLFFINSISSSFLKEIEKENTIQRQIRSFQQELWKKYEKPMDDSYFKIFV